MAYMVGNEGPYPNLASEFCGNVSESCYMIHRRGIHGVFEDKRPGRPRPTGTKTTEQLEAEGRIGLYLKRALPHNDVKFHRRTIREVQTPPELMEPPEGAML